jgi:hypothetical protein
MIKISQYVEKYSAAYWGTSFVADLTKITPNDNAGADWPPVFEKGEVEKEMEGLKLEHGATATTS